MAITVNTTDYEIRRAREELAGSLGSLDAKRPAAWQQYGYKQTLDFADFLTAYERGGPAHGAVHRILDKCWQALPRIKKPEADDPGPWEKKVSATLKAIGAWAKLRDLDRRNMVGHYAALIYRVADGKKLYEPLERASKLVDLVPVYESQIRVESWDLDENSEHYGTPTMFSIETAPPTQRNEQARPRTWLKVHPSRVQLLAEGAVGDNFLDGVPLLKAGFNHLVDLEKISGGSAESYLKNSARTLVLKFDAAASPQNITQNPDGSASGKTVAEALEEKTRDLNRNIDSSIVTQGGDVTTLQTQQSDPEPSFLVAANLFAASVRIPMTILFGAQTGRLASDEDKADMIARCTSRQANELTPMLAQFVTRMQAAGIIEAGEFEIEWPPLDAPGDEEKFALMDKLTQAMERAFRAGLSEPLFDANELRAVAGFEPRADDGMPEEGDDPPADADPGDGGDMGGDKGRRPPK